MINRDTVRALSLQPVTRDKCHDFYIKINTEFQNTSEIVESVSWWQDDSIKLNNLWWVLNYYSDRFDPDRHIRAIIEQRLDDLALKLKETLET